MNVLVTGGAGFIGSHTCVELLSSNHDVIVLDNLVNSRIDTLSAIEKVAGKHPVFIEGDIRDRSNVQRALQDYGIEAVIHFAALKAVGESWQRPLDYFENNISGTISLLQAMTSSGVRHLVFSSSATVYGEPDYCPIPESAITRTTNPYGRTKLICEQLISDWTSSNSNFKAATLRYFNPVGAHPSGLIGEEPNGIPNNLMPYVAQVATGERPFLQVFGSDYPTHDGTGVRDYIHVVDLATAHVQALEYLLRERQSITVNLGTGQGYSVLDVVKAFEHASGRTIPTRVVNRRQGDVASCYADPSLAHHLLDWKASRGLDQMCADAWRWQIHRTSTNER